MKGKIKLGMMKGNLFTNLKDWQIAGLQISGILFGISALIFIGVNIFT